MEYHIQRVILNQCIKSDCCRKVQYKEEQWKIRISGRGCKADTFEEEEEQDEENLYLTDFYKLQRFHSKLMISGLTVKHIATQSSESNPRQRVRLRYRTHFTCERFAAPDSVSLHTNWDTGIAVKSLCKVSPLRCECNSFRVRNYYYTSLKYLAQRKKREKYVWNSAAVECHT